MRNRTIKAGKINFSFSVKKAEMLKQAIEHKEKKGYFIWICTHGSVDRIVGYHFRRGWIADYCYLAAMTRVELAPHRVIAGHLNHLTSWLNINMQS
jgi:hypothetical protein